MSDRPLNSFLKERLTTFSIAKIWLGIGQGSSISSMGVPYKFDLVVDELSPYKIKPSATRIAEARSCRFRFPCPLLVVLSNQTLHTKNLLYTESKKAFNQDQVKVFNSTFSTWKELILACLFSYPSRQASRGKSLDPDSFTPGLALFTCPIVSNTNKVSQPSLSWCLLPNRKRESV